jgi:hypothetical protein
MRSLMLLFAVLISLPGCESSPPPKSVVPDPFHKKAIYAALKREQVPIPQSTPYDGDAHKRSAFNEGFRSG